jgi:hypothetical protein
VAFPADAIASVDVMPSTFPALLIFLLAVLPGAIYIWSFERVVGRWGIGLADRVFRFIAVSAAFQLTFGVVAYVMWTTWAYQSTNGHPGRWARDRATHGTAFPWWVYAVPLAYLLVPALFGTAAGRAVGSRRWHWLGTAVAGRDPAPRAWDHLFGPRPSGLVRALLKGDGGWVGGLFGEFSYAAGYPEPQDLYLERAYAFDQAAGTFARDADGFPVPLGSGLLVRWDELEFLEFFPEEAA